MTSTRDQPPSDSLRNESLGNESPTNAEAMLHVTEVKNTFHDQKHKYHMYLDALNDYRAERIDLSTVIARVKELFKGHNNLIVEFNRFMPPGSELIPLDDEASSITVETIQSEEDCHQSSHSNGN